MRKNRIEEDLTNYDVAAPHQETPPARAQVRAEVEALGEALRSLPKSQRQCWLLCEISEYSYSQISDELHISHSTVRGLLARARKTLLTKLEPWR